MMVHPPQRGGAWKSKTEKKIAVAVGLTVACGLIAAEALDVATLKQREEQGSTATKPRKQRHERTSGAPRRHAAQRPAQTASSFLQFLKRLAPGTRTTPAVQQQPMPQRHPPALLPAIARAPQAPALTVALPGVIAGAPDAPAARGRRDVAKWLGPITDKEVTQPLEVFHYIQQGIENMADTSPEFRNKVLEQFQFGDHDWNLLVEDKVHLGEKLPNIIMDKFILLKPAKPQAHLLSWFSHRTKSSTSLQESTSAGGILERPTH
ncbi:unnamed protein product [Amoebophrya sp. A120]|nr:unnamed protein product [Amoebophrya sp. A120]|eukprot:GSA120T00004631001.1